MPSSSALRQAIKDTLKEGTATKSSLRKQLKSQLKAHGDKASQKAALAAAVAKLVAAGKVAENGDELSAASSKKRSLVADDSASSSSGAAAEPVKAKKAKKAKLDDAACTSATTDDSAEDVAYRAEHQIGATDLDESPVALPPPFRSFAAAPYGDAVQRLFSEAGYTSPSPIQAQGWPMVLTGQDLVAVAKTGSGKTVAFLLPIFQHIFAARANGSGGSKRKGPQCLVLAPTRELAVQIYNEAAKFGAAFQISACQVYGGVPKGPQIEQLKANPDLVIATPGRMKDLLESKATTLSTVTYLVLDEADRMLDMGFEPEIKFLIGECAPTTARQSLFFSATWPKSVRQMAANYLKPGCVRLTIGNQSDELAANTAVSQEFHKLDDSEKDAALNKILTEDATGENDKVIVFTNTKRRVDYISKTFWQEGFGTCGIHGDKQQADRDKSLAKFVSGEWPIMVATDVAARGLDIPNVTHVINFDMPRDLESYVHRIGRTGRAGKKGKSITFFNHSYDVPCSAALVKVAEDAKQPVPDWLLATAKKSKANKNWKV